MTQRTKRDGVSAARDGASRNRAAGGAARGQSSRGVHGSGGGRQGAPYRGPSPGGAGGGARTLLTRRTFLYGAIGAAGVAGAAGIAAGVNHYVDSKNAATETPLLDIPKNAVENSDAYEEAETGATLRSEMEMPFGTLVWASTADVAACLVPTNGSKPLTYVSLLSLGSGSDTTVLEEPVGMDDGFEIYDVRATPEAIIWTEANVLQGVWRIYSSQLSGLSLVAASLMQEGSCADWETPTIAAVGPYVYWQVLPNVNGEHAVEQSTLKKAEAGADTYYTVVRSTGRMATAPYALEDGIVVTPRADAEGVSYEPTLIDAETDAVLDCVRMPQNMKPAEVGYGKNGFVIAMDAIYDYNDGLSNLGCYTPVSKPSTPAGYADAGWFTYTRQPSAAPCWSGRWFVVKSTQAVCGFDPATKENFVLDVHGGSQNWGDYLATTGICDSFVTYAHVDYTPMNAGVANEEGELEGELETAMYGTLVRVWQTS